MAGRRYGIRGLAAKVAAAVAGLLVAAAGLPGCAAEHEVRTAPTELTAPGLRSDGLAVASVTVVDEVEQKRPPLVAALERALAADRPDLPFRHAESVKDALGLAAYRRILSAYQSSGRLTAAEQSDLRAALGTGTRYVVLARVEKDAIRESGRRPRTSPYEQPPPAAMSFITISRDARVRVTLFDLLRSRVAFEASYASSSDNAPADSLPKPPRRPSAAVGDARVVDPPEGAPDLSAPDLADALVEAFHAFAADLPR